MSVQCLKLQKKVLRWRPCLWLMLQCQRLLIAMWSTNRFTRPGWTLNMSFLSLARVKKVGLSLNPSQLWVVFWSWIKPETCIQRLPEGEYHWPSGWSSYNVTTRLCVQFWNSSIKGYSFSPFRIPLLRHDSSVHSFVQEIFLGNPLCESHHSRHFPTLGKTDKSWSREAYILMWGINGKQVNKLDDRKSYIKRNQGT